MAVVSYDTVDKHALTLNLVKDVVMGEETTDNGAMVVDNDVCRDAHLAMSKFYDGRRNYSPF